MSEREIINSLFGYTDTKGHKYMCSNTTCIPNVGECDFLSVSKAMFITEYEIKVTKSDFKADFKNKINKHKRMSGEKIERKKWVGISADKFPIYETWKEIQLPFVNYFYFVCPEGLIKIEDVPDYAGLIYVKEYKETFMKTGRIIPTEVKKPRRFHNNKLSNNILLKMYRSVMYKYYR